MSITPSAITAEVTVVNVSRTTERRRKKGVGVPRTPWKGYACGICGKHKSSKHFQNKIHVASYVFLILAEATGHSQYISKYIKRKWYCPFQEVPKEEWLVLIEAEERVMAAAFTAITNTSTTTVTNTSYYCNCCHHHCHLWKWHWWDILAWLALMYDFSWMVNSIMHTDTQ